MFFFIIIIFISFSLTYLVRYYAIRASIIDIPNDRSSHTIPTPRGGGIAVATAWFAGLVYFWIKGNIADNLFYALLAGLPLTLIGFVDDVISLKPGVRFLVQFACAALALWFLGGLKTLELGFLSIDYIWLLTPVAFVAIVWSVNLFNFLDGIDGYISTEVIFIGVAVFLITGDSLGLLLAASILGFLFWNWQKAKIFMGDVGSTLLGFTVAVFAIYHQNIGLSSVPVWLILTSVFWFDATLTLGRRFMNKEKLSEAHRKHAYQRIVQSGFSHQKTVLWSLTINIVGLGLALLAYNYKSYSLVFLVVDVVLLYAVVRYIDAQKPFEYKKS